MSTTTACVAVLALSCGDVVRSDVKLRRACDIRDGGHAQWLSGEESGRCGRARAGSSEDTAAEVAKFTVD